MINQQIPIARARNRDEAIQTRKKRKNKTVCQKKGHHTYKAISSNYYERDLKCIHCGNQTTAKNK